MHLLSRKVRLAILGNPGENLTPSPNAYASWPAMSGVGVFAELDVVVVGTLTPIGYLLDIKSIDSAVRESAMPILKRVTADTFAGKPESPQKTLASLATAIGKAIPAHAAQSPVSNPTAHLHSLTWYLTPRTKLEWTAKAPTMSTSTATYLRQNFDFAASHRLHVPTLSAEKNRELFGKCNHENGHGHNYRLETCVIPAENFSLINLERIVDDVIFKPFDHRYLNEDTTVFDPRRGGMNPTVENIARVCFELLQPQIAKTGSKLAQVTVWETDRTGATYPVL